MTRHRHDSRIRSEWLPIGVTRTEALGLVDALEAALEETGSIDRTAHAGRRGNDADRLSVTRPSGRYSSHVEPGRYTVKIRGCDLFRARAKALAPAIAHGRRLTYAGLDANYEQVDG